MTSKTIINIDPRGVKRGKCTKCSECLIYQYNEKSETASCFYCADPAPAHERIDNMVLPDQNILAVESNQSGSFVVSFTPSKCGGMAAGVQQVPASNPVVLRVPHQSDMPSHPEVIVLNPQKNLLSDILNNADKEINSDDVPLPNVLPDSINTALAQRKLGAKERSAICRAVVFKLMDEGKASNDHLLKAAKKIRAKYSPMKHATDPKGQALYKKLLRTRDRKKNGPASKKLAPLTESAPLSGAEAKEAMIQDWASGKRSVTTMAAYLATTRTLRNKEACKTKSLELLVDYPGLTIHELLLQEFSAMQDIQLPVKEMRENWIKKLPYFRKYFKDFDIYRIDENFSSEQQTVSVLENLHKVPVWYKKPRPKRGESLEPAEESRAIRVLEIFHENTSIAEARPYCKDPLRISGIGEAMGSVSFFAISDSEPIFTTNDPIDAMLLLLATYWVFHLSFGSANKHPILFLAACVLGPVRIKNYISRNEKFLDLCRDHFGMIV